MHGQALRGMQWLFVPVHARSDTQTELHVRPTGGCMRRPNMKYELDLRLLDKRYKQLQWSVHPDRLAKHTPQVGLVVQGGEEGEGAGGGL